MYFAAKAVGWKSRLRGIRIDRMVAFLEGM
jgi:hypothetical protein